MSSNNSGTITGVAYQSIIIALIAGGILTIGVVSILWRRRSQRHWVMRSDANLPLGMGMGMGMGFGTDGDGVGAGRGGRKRKRLGRMPEVWDALIGRREREGEGEGQERLGNVDRAKWEEEEEGVEDGMMEAKHAEKGRGEKDDVGVLSAEAGEEWRPISIALHEHPNSLPSPLTPHASLPPPPAPPPTFSAEMTVLIAMPSPDRPIPFRSSPIPSHLGTSGQGYSPDGSDSKGVDYQAHYTYIRPPLPPHADAEDECLPELAIATTSVLISLSPPSPASSTAAREELQQWIDDAQTTRLAGSSSSGPSRSRGVPSRRPAPLIDSAGYRANEQDHRRPSRDGRDSEHEQEHEHVGWAGRLGIPGVIRRGDMIARPRTPERDRRSGWNGSRSGRGRDAEYDAEANRAGGQGEGGGYDDVEGDPRARPNLFRLASMSHSLGVFRFGNMAGLPAAQAGAGHRDADGAGRSRGRGDDAMDRRSGRDAGGVGMAVHRAQYL